MRSYYNKSVYRKNRIATGKARSRRAGCVNACSQEQQSHVAWRLAPPAGGQRRVTLMHCMTREKDSTKRHITIDAYVVWLASFRHGYIASTSSDSVRTTC
jgi:hypothetical protein